MPLFLFILFLLFGFTANAQEPVESPEVETDSTETVDPPSSSYDFAPDKDFVLDFHEVASFASMDCVGLNAAFQYFDLIRDTFDRGDARKRAIIGGIIGTAVGLASGGKAEDVAAGAAIGAGIGGASVLGGRDARRYYAERLHFLNLTGTLAGCVDFPLTITFEPGENDDSNGDSDSGTYTTGHHDLPHEVESGKEDMCQNYWNLYQNTGRSVYKNAFDENCQPPE